MEDKTLYTLCSAAQTLAEFSLGEVHLWMLLHEPSQREREEEEGEGERRREVDVSRLGIEGGLTFSEYLVSSGHQRSGVPSAHHNHTLLYSRITQPAYVYTSFCLWS